MHITSPKRKRTIKRTLNTIAFEPQGNSIGSLHGIVAPYTFEMIKDDFEDLMKNSGYYSQIIEVKVDGERVFFNESSQQGESEIFYKKKNLVSLTFNEEKLLSEIDQEQDRDKRLILKQTLKEKVSTSSYSLTFLKVVKNLCTILDAQDRIIFSIKTDTPLKVQISFKKLSKTFITYYLAPRVPEEDFEEVDEDDFYENQEQEIIQDQTEE